MMLALAIIDLIYFQFNVIETKGKPLIDNMPDKSQSWLKRDKRNIELITRTENFPLKDKNLANA